MNTHNVSLDELGLKFGTDKASTHHDYLEFYERFFAKFRHKNIRVLEVGVFEGASIKVWEEYFPNAAIIGADINPAAARFGGPRVAIEIIDQSNIEDLVRLGVNHGPFDIIIEDGSHLWEHQITTLRTLFPFLRNGGIYIAEDLQTNFGSLAAQHRGVSSISCVEYLKKLVDLRVADENINIEQEEDPFLRTYGRAMRFIAFYRRACLIEKSLPQNHRQARVDQPFLQIDQDPAFVPLFLLAHLGGEGDKFSNAGFLCCTDENHNFQGFLLENQSKNRIEIMSRARLQDGKWTEWVELGRFSGTRGKNQDVTGVSVRLGDASRKDYNLQVVGQFRNEPNLVIVSEGEDCIPKLGLGKLFGMQVILRSNLAPQSPQ